MVKKRIFISFLGFFMLFSMGFALDEGLDDGFVPRSMRNDGELPKGMVQPSSESFRLNSVLGAVAPAGHKPNGALSDIIVYCSGGHGFTADTGNSVWFTQRGLLNGVVEDMGNIDQLNMFADYCFNAGATVVPMRPLGHQTNEVVLDNDDADVVYSGTWYDSSATIYFGDVGDTPYRYAYVSTNGETSIARYRPNIPASGNYPVYTWVRSGSDRVKQNYRIAHAGGISVVDVNHRRVGLGWVWLGTYWFEQGTNGYVDISNDAPGYDPGNDVVIADAIRFGNGMGDVDRGFGVSGFERELECARYWVQRSMGQGLASTIYDLNGYSDQNDNVGAPRRMAESMNREADGSFFDRIYLGFHSNANDGANRGALALYDTRYSSAFQGLQKAYGQAMNHYLERNMEWGDSGVVFNDDWTDSSGDLYGSLYGEIYGSISNEMNTTIMEVAFHDNVSDCYLLKDAVARRVMAWSCYQGIVEHLHTNNASIPLVFLPEPPTAPVAVNVGDGSVAISWMASITNGLGAGAPTGYVVYVSADGRAFGNPVYVFGAVNTVVSNLAVDATWYFRVAALNEGGESLPSETVGVRVSNAGPSQHLVVNGFDRCDRSLSPLRYFANNINGSVAMVRPEQINRYDYVIEHGEAIAKTNAWFDSCGHGAVTNGDVVLTDYAAVYWILGEESTTDSTLDDVEQEAISTFLDAGGCLMVSGAELAWDLDYRGSVADKLFMTNVLRTAYVADDASTNRVSGVGGSLFEDVPAFTFQEGVGDAYSVEYPDCLSARNGADSALVYGSGYNAATVFSNGYKIVVMGFPFETITSDANRSALMGRIVGFFDAGEPYLEIVDGSRTIAQSITAWTLNGTSVNCAGDILWSNMGYSSGSLAVTSPWSMVVTNLQLGANVIQVTASNNAGVSVTREVTITRSTNAFGNGWHIPANNEPGMNTMRDPVSPLAFQTVYFFSGNQFSGDGNAANQTGGMLYYRKVGAGSWSSATLNYDSEAGQNKYWYATLAGKTYEAGDNLEYYFEIMYSDRDTSYIGTWDAGLNSAVFVVKAEAAEHAFQFTYGGYPGNCWHIPDMEEPSTVTMRNPTDPCAFQQVFVYSGNQFQGAGNVADQIGGILHYRKQEQAEWISVGMSFDVLAGNNKYWVGAVPSNTFVTGDVVEYYVEVQYDDRDTTYISLATNAALYAAGAYRVFAAEHPFVYTNQGYPGNCWHIPDNQEPEGLYMRDPLVMPNVSFPVYIRSGNQFAGEGNPGDQTGLVLHYRVGISGPWQVFSGSFETEEGQNKFWRCELPADHFEEGCMVQYYLEVTYAYHDISFVSTDGVGNSRVFINENEAQAAPFHFQYASTAEVIRFQGFEGTSADDWALLSGMSYISGDDGAGDTVPADQRIRSGDYSWQRQDADLSSIVGFELEDVLLTGYTNVTIYLHLSATDPSYLSSGMDDDDYVKVHVATNGYDYNENAEITIFGFGGGVRWGYDAYGVAATECGVYRSYQPMDDSPIVRTNDGYSILKIDVPDTVDQIRVKVNTLKQYINEYWNIDDVTLTGMRDQSDADHDGASAYAESVAGTDPERVDSVLALVGCEEGNSRVVRWPGVSNRSYEIYYTTNLQSAFRSMATNLMATPPLNAYTDVLHGAEQAIYYRIQVSE